ATFEQERADAFRPAQGERERQARTHRVSREEERTLRQYAAQLFERRVPAGRGSAGSVSGKVGCGDAEAVQRIAQVVECAAVASESMQERERLARSPAGGRQRHGISSAAATIRCSSR